MELLERYLNQIKKHLPLKDREDTLNELRSLILEEFDSKSNDSDNEDILYEIIKDYGYPVEVAARYRSSEPIISNVIRPYFYMVLKIISTAIPFGMLLATTIGFMDQNQSFKLLDLLLKMAYSIPSIINALIMGYGFVFISFVLIEKYARPELEKEIPSFEPKTLPNIPKDVFKISIFEHIFEIMMWVLFLYLLNYTEGLISISLEDVKYPLLNENFNSLLPFLNFSILFALFISILELTRQRRFKVSITLDYIRTLYFGIILFVLASNDIFTTVVIDGYGLGILPNIFRIMMYIGGLASIIGGTISFIKTIKRIKH